MRCLYFIPLVLSLMACATSGTINAVQLGMKKAEVIKVMGDPVSVSAKGDTEYLNYKLSETDDDAFAGRTTPYFVRLVDGRVDSFGRTGDFDSTQKPTVRVESDEKINIEGNADLYTELKKLKELRDEGILTEAEYKEQKKKVLEQY